MKLPTMTQTYKDGTLSIYSVENIGVAGNRKIDKLVAKHPLLRFDYRTVGMSRFWNAKQNKVEISQLVRTPRMLDVSTQDVVVLRGKQYVIEQVQYPEEERRSMDLSLRCLEVNYDFAEEN